MTHWPTHELQLARSVFGEPAGADAHPPRILLVEDDEVDAMALRRHAAAHQLGYAITVAPSLAAARASLAREPFDLVLLDQQLADGDGFELFAEIRDLPVIFITGNNDLSQAVRAVRAGAADYLVKDTARRYLDLLPHTVDRALQEHRTQRDFLRVSHLGRRIFDEAAIGKMLVRPDGTVLRASQATCRLTGRTEAELIADGLPLFVDPAGLEECQRQLATLCATQPTFNVEKACRHRDGSALQVRFHVARILLAVGEPGLCIVQLEDLTETRRREEQQRLLEAQLTHARRLEAIGTLAGGVAHEFNNLLTSILSNIQLAELDLPEGHPARSGLATAVNSCRQSRDLIQRLVGFSRESGPAHQPVALAELVRQTFDLLRPGLPADLALELDLAPDCPPVSADAAEIREALLQICRNALQACGPGGRIALRLRTEVPAEDFRRHHPQVRPDRQVCLRIEDNGPGMDALALSRIFEPFYTTRAPGTGAGLGLAGVYGSMRRHGGSVVVTSEPDRGTQVSLFFPVQTDLVPLPR